MFLRKWLHRILTDNKELPHLGVENSRRIAVIHCCLFNLTSDTILTSDLKRLITLTPKEIFESGVDSEDIGLKFVNGFIMELISISHQWPDKLYRGKDKDSHTSNFAQELAAALLPPFLTYDLKDARSVETRMVALQCLEHFQIAPVKVLEFSETSHEPPRKAVMQSVESPFESGDEQKISKALGMFRKLIPNSRDINFLERKIFSSKSNFTSYNRTEAAGVLAEWAEQRYHDVSYVYPDPWVGDDRRKHNAIENFRNLFLANRESFNFEQKLHLTGLLRESYPKLAFTTFLQLISEAESDDELLSVLSLAKLIVPHERLLMIRIGELSDEEYAKSIQQVLGQLGRKDNITEEALESFTERMIESHPDGIDWLKRFIKRTKFKKQKEVAMQLLSVKVSHKYERAVNDLTEFTTLNTESMEYFGKEAPLIQVLESSEQLLYTDYGSAEFRQSHIQSILDLHARAQNRLKELAADPEADLHEWASEVLEAKKQKLD